MKQEITTLVQKLETLHTGEPWFGRAIFNLLDEVDVRKINLHLNSRGHSMLDLLWHMNTWASFTLKRLEKNQDPDDSGELDWRNPDPRKDTWNKALRLYKATHRKIIRLLKKKTDAYLREKVDYRDYNYKFLLEGLAEHNIYHAGQIAFLNKYL